MNQNKKKLMAYFYMPLIFVLAGFAIVYVAFHPVITMAEAIGSMLISQEAPDFNDKLNSIYTEPETTNTEAQQISSSQIQNPEVGDLYAKVTCDRIGLTGPLYMGDTKAILKAGIGQYYGSFIPGYGRPLLIAAHNTTYFRPLQDIIEGDIVTISTSYGVYQYKVTGTRVALATDESAYNLTQDKEQLIMYTCYPFDMLTASKSERFFVYADKISGPDIVD